MAGLEPSPDSRYVHHLLSQLDLRRSLQHQTTQVSESPKRDQKLDETITSSGTAATANRRPRGRPLGSKNKPKPPIIVTQDSPNSFGSHVLEVSSGADIMESVSNYARCQCRGVCILSGHGTVVNVTLRLPGTPSGSVVTLHGAFDVLSLSGMVLPPPAPPGAGGMAIFLAGGQGQIVGGSVVGPLMALGPVVLMVASFTNAVYERLSLEEEYEESPEQVHPATSQSSSGQLGEGSRGGNDRCNRNGDGNGGDSLYNMGMNMENYKFSGDVFGWSGNATRPHF